MLRLELQQALTNYENLAIEIANLRQQLSAKDNEIASLRATVSNAARLELTGETPGDKVGKKVANEVNRFLRRFE